MNTTVFEKDGFFAMLALDHDASFKRMINAGNPDQVSKDEIIALKGDLISACLPYMSGMLVDSEYGLPAYHQVSEGGKGTSYLLRIEKSGHSGEENNRINDREFTALELKNKGAEGVKLLLYINPDVPAFALQKEFARAVIEEAHEIALPVFVEFVTYDVPEHSRTRFELMDSALRLFIDEGIVPDIWKLEYPESKENSEKITERVGETPWILLSRGVSFDEFLPQLTEAKDAGAKGFLVGRALWQEIGGLRGEEKEIFLKQTIPERFTHMNNVFHS